MLIAHVERYLSLRQMLGYKLRNTSGNLRAFARFAAGKGDTHVRISTAMDWATEGTSPSTRHIRLRDTAQLARFLHAEEMSRVVSTPTPSLRNDARVDCRDRAPHFGGARPPAP